MKFGEKIGYINSKLMKNDDLATIVMYESKRNYLGLTTLICAGLVFVNALFLITSPPEYQGFMAIIILFLGVLTAIKALEFYRFINTIYKSLVENENNSN